MILEKAVHHGDTAGTAKNQKLADARRLNSNVRKFGVMLLTDAAVLAAALLWWYRREAKPA